VICAGIPLYGRKGPVHLSGSNDHFEKRINFSRIPKTEYRCTESVKVETKQISKIVEELKNSAKPLLLIGQRCWYPNISDKLQELFEKFGIPVIVTRAQRSHSMSFLLFRRGVGLIRS